MASIVQLKTSEEDFEVEYEILSHNSSQTATHGHTSMADRLDEIDMRRSEIQYEIGVLDPRIDKLTNHADGLDYTIAIASGIITGLIDVFWVDGIPLDAATQWGKDKADEVVKFVAKQQGFRGDSLEGAVSFLEKKFLIPADTVTNEFGGGLTHHLKDFSHHPNPIGLYYSMKTQFTGKAYGTDKDGAFISVSIPNPDLIGKDLSSKIAIGFTNWMFHMVSDIAGSSSSIAKGKYGTGLPGPFVSLLKRISATKFFSHQENNNEFCLWVSKLFNGTLLAKRDGNGKLIPDSIIKFDLRAELGLARNQVIPVVINECIVRVLYFIRRLVHEIETKDVVTFNDFVHKIDWKTTLPFNNRTISRMMTIASGTFVAVDAVGAVIRSAQKSEGDKLKFYANMVLNINFVGIGRCVIAIATDSYMGYKRSRLINERLRLMSEHLMLSNARVFYKQADMWIAAKDAQEAIEKMQETAKYSIFYATKSLVDIGMSVERIGNDMKDINKNNPGLQSEISDLFKYGK